MANFINQDEADAYCRLKSELNKNNNFLIEHNIRYFDDHIQMIREIDIFIFNPSEGILLIEVKGTADFNETRDPFLQMDAAVASVRRKLRDLSKRHNKNLNVPLGYAVFFPSIEIGLQDLPAHASKDRILDKKDRGNLLRRVTSIMRLNRDPLFNRLQKEDVLLLRNEFIQQIARFKPRLSDIVGSQTDELVKLTEEQKRILDNLEHKNQLAIEGYAGTGKTCLAIEKAVRLCLENRKVALICYNEFLALSLKDSVGNLLCDDETMLVGSFAKIAEKIIKDEGMKIESPGENDNETSKRNFFTKLLPKQMCIALTNLKDKYDAVIIDEGQDFTKEMFEAVRHLLKDEKDGIFYIFFDSKQNIFRDRKLELPVSRSDIILRRNCRNTANIGMYTSYFGDVRLTTHTVVGEKPEFIKWKNNDEQLEKMKKLIEDLTINQMIPKSHIVCLTVIGLDNGCLHNKKSIGKIKITKDWKEWKEVNNEKILYTSLRRFKGLEAEILIICDLSNDFNEIDIKLAKTSFYTAFSRAMLRLFVFHQNNWKPPELQS